MGFRYGRHGFELGLGLGLRLEPLGLKEIPPMKARELKPCCDCRLSIVECRMSIVRVPSPEC